MQGARPLSNEDALCPHPRHCPPPLPPPFPRSVATNLAATALEWVMGVYLRTLFLASCADRAFRQEAPKRMSE